MLSAPMDMWADALPRPAAVRTWSGLLCAHVHACGCLSAVSCHVVYGAVRLLTFCRHLAALSDSH